MSKTMQPELKAAHAAMTAKLTEVTHDPVDAMRLAADLYAMTAYRAERVVAIDAGAPRTRAPKPRSMYLRSFTASLKAKLSAVAGLFVADELERLRKLGPELARRLERNEAELTEEILELVCMTPHDAAAWIRSHLDEIEARFAS